MSSAIFEPAGFGGLKFLRARTAPAGGTGEPLRILVRPWGPTPALGWARGGGPRTRGAAPLVGQNLQILRGTFPRLIQTGEGFLLRFRRRRGQPPFATSEEPTLLPWGRSPDFFSLRFVWGPWAPREGSTPRWRAFARARLHPMARLQRRAPLGALRCRRAIG